MQPIAAIAFVLATVQAGTYCAGTNNFCVTGVPAKNEAGQLCFTVHSAKAGYDYKLTAAMQQLELEAQCKEQICILGGRIRRETM
jgi:hypothetical protein